MNLRNDLRMNFEEVHQSYKDGDPIMLTKDAASRLCRMYGETLGGFFTEQNNGKEQEHINAYDVLLWLGF